MRHNRLLLGLMRIVGAASPGDAPKSRGPAAGSGSKPQCNIGFPGSYFDGHIIQGKADANLLRALIFDFDGVIVDSEPIICKLTQEMAAMEGWKVSEEDYYRHYLALDDRGIVEHLYGSHGRPVDTARRDELVAWKARKYFGIIRDGLPPLPGAAEFVRAAARRYPLAIASGSLRTEIEHLLDKLELRAAFRVLVTANDCEKSKPEPEVYHKAVRKLGKLAAFARAPLAASECLAIEDAPFGVVAAHAAGMKCLALAHSRPARELGHADWVIEHFSEANLGIYARAFENN